MILLLLNINKHLVRSLGATGALEIEPLDVHANSNPHRGTGGGGMEPLPPRILFCCSMSKRFHLQWKAFDLLNKMRYILWVVVLLRACDVTNNDCHIGHHLGFYQELQVRLKPREMVIFFVLDMKQDT